MTKEEAKALYAGKTFYIVEKDGRLLGPRDDIYYANRKYLSLFERVKVTIQRALNIGEHYEFLQVIEGIPVRAFTKDEILVKQEIV